MIQRETPFDKEALPHGGARTLPQKPLWHIQKEVLCEFFVKFAQHFALLTVSGIIRFFILCGEQPNDLIQPIQNGADTDRSEYNEEYRGGDRLFKEDAEN